MCVNILFVFCIVFVKILYVVCFVFCVNFVKIFIFFGLLSAFKRMPIRSNVF
jgi:hypothetical protein